MQEAALVPLIAWQMFYVLIGTAAATLTGLMFVVVTLLTGRQVRRPSSSAFTTFNTPNVVHFGLTGLLAALLIVPWPTLWSAGLLLGLVGLVGVSYVLIVVRRVRRLRNYQPELPSLVLEDLLFHMVLPLVSYSALLIAALLLLSSAAVAFFVFAAVTLLLLFTSLHNAWDSVTFIAFELSQPENKRQE